MPQLTAITISSQRGPAVRTKATRVPSRDHTGNWSLPPGGGVVSRRADTWVVPCSWIALAGSARCLPANAKVDPSGDNAGWRSCPGSEVSAL